MKASILIENLKCGGCANSIKNALMELPGVNDVIVDHDQEMVNVTGDDGMNLDIVKEKLHHLGYPEKGSVEGFDKFASTAKSYVSCAIGKLSDN